MDRVCRPKARKKLVWHDWWIDVVGPKQKIAQLGLTGIQSL